jgi:hypothetical protein
MADFLVSSCPERGGRGFARRGSQGQRDPGPLPGVTTKASGATHLCRSDLMSRIRPFYPVDGACILG